jgi:two-component system phosphate regulon response regulator OmpR
MAASVIVVDDEADLREAVGTYLRRQGLTARIAAGAAELRDALAKAPADLILLDIAMPEEDGLSIARRLRAEGFQGGIIMLTAAADVVDRVVGLETGADDYVTKPADLRELLARVRSVLRRVAARTPPEVPPNIVPLGACRLDLDARRLAGADGADIPITAMEFDLLKALAERRGRVLSRDTLLELAHNKGWEAFDRSIDVRIARLRRKIEADPAKPAVIKTVRGAGYLLARDG